MLHVLIFSNGCNQNIQKNAKITIYLYRKNKITKNNNLVFSLGPIQWKVQYFTSISILAHDLDQNFRTTPTFIDME